MKENNFVQIKIVSNRGHRMQLNIDFSVKCMLQTLAMHGLPDHLRLCESLVCARMYYV